MSTTNNKIQHSNSSQQVQHHKATHTTTSTQVQPKDTSIKPIHFQWYDSLPIIGVFLLYFFAVMYIRRTKKAKDGRYRFSYVLNIVPMVIAIYAALYPIKLEWLPEIDFYSVRFLGWTALLILAVRFLWTLFLQFDNDGLFLQGDHHELTDIEDRMVDEILEAEAAFRDGQTILFDNQVRQTFVNLKALQFQPEEEYYWAAGLYLDFFVNKTQHGPEYDTYVWTLTDINQNRDIVPLQYWKAVQEAIDKREAVPLKGKVIKANGLAYYIGHNIVMVLVRKDGKLMNTNHVLHMWKNFDAFLSNL